MLTRINSLEKNINELMELKNTEGELHTQVSIAKREIDQTEVKISEIEDQLHEIKQEGKIREKRAKRNEQNLQEYGIM